MNNKITIMDKHLGKDEGFKKELFLKYEKILQDTLKVLKQKSKEESQEYIAALLKAALEDGFSYGFYDAYVLLEKE